MHLDLRAIPEWIRVTRVFLLRDQRSRFPVSPLCVRIVARQDHDDLICVFNTVANPVDDAVVQRNMGHVDEDINVGIFT